MKRIEIIISLVVLGIIAVLMSGCREAGKLNGIDRADISRCCNGYRKSAKGFKWAFA